MKMIRDDNTNIQAKQNDKLQMSTRLTNKYHDANTVTATNVSPVSDPFTAHNLNIFSRNSFGSTTTTHAIPPATTRSLLSQFARLLTQYSPLSYLSIYICIDLSISRLVLNGLYTGPAEGSRAFGPPRGRTIYNTV
jgi:hypothetical protein